MRGFLPDFRSRPQQRGVSVISAVFLLMLMGSLAAFMANLISVSHSNLAADIGGARAYQAARAGVEWAMFQLYPNAATAAEKPLPACSLIPATPPTILDHTIVVTCAAFPSDTTAYTEGTRTIRVFRITAVAKATGAKAPGIERQVEVTVEKCRDSTITAPPYDC